VRRHGIDRNTVRGRLRSDAPPVYQRASASKLDPFKDAIYRVLKADPQLPGRRIRELIAPLGFEGGKTIVDDYLREVRPLFAVPPERFSASIGLVRSASSMSGSRAARFRSVTARPGRHGLSLRAWLRARRRRRADLHRADARLARRDPALPMVVGCVAAPVVWDRQAGIHGHGACPSEEFAALRAARAQDAYALPSCRLGLERFIRQRPTSSSPYAPPTPHAPPTPYEANRICRSPLSVPRRERPFRRPVRSAGALRG
jgi:hypothetical protein